MLSLDKMTRTMDTIAPRRQRPSANTARDNRRAGLTAIFSPVYASPDDVDFQREERFEPQCFPR